MGSLLFLYGEIRSFETAIKTWNILNIPNLDIVIHTPNTNSNHFNNKTFNDVSRADFDKLENPKIFFYDRDDYLTTDTHVLHYSYRFLSKYLKTSKKYKYIFIGRLDSTFYIHKLEEFFENSDESLYVQEFPKKENMFLPDHTFFGNYDVVKKFVDNLPPSAELEHSHQDMGKYLINHKFDLSLWDSFESRHVRDNMEDIFNEYFKDRNPIQDTDNDYIEFYKTNNKLFIKLDNEYKHRY